MQNAENQMEMGLTLLGQLDLFTASLYFEDAGEAFLKSEDFSKALEAYTKLLYCFSMDEKTGESEIAEVQKVINSIK